MSLENQIENLTAAVEALTAKLSGAMVKIVDNSSGATETPPTAEDKPKRTRAKKEEVAPEVTKKHESVFDDEEEVSLEDDGLGLDDEPEITEADLKGKFSKLAQVKGRETVLSLFKKYGATNFQSIKTTDYAKVYAEVNSLLGG